jgi:hypothetical protein
MQKLFLAGVLIACAARPAEITVSGTRFLLEGKPFPFTGVSFFNAIYNPALHKSAQDRAKWLEKFKRYGIHVLRVWAQWDNKRGFVDACPTCSLYEPDGKLREPHVARLKDLAKAANEAGMVIELTLFSQESWREGMRIENEAAARAITSLAKEMLPYRNIIFQVWNEASHAVLDHVKTIRAADPKRLVTNSPGYAGDLGDPAQNQALDFLTPHTSRQRQGRPWRVGPKEIAYLLERYRKPVVDDEPARNGTIQFGGPGEQTYPMDHILQIYQVWRAGGHIIYHHDMFQMGYGHESIPPSGIPDPEFSPYHRRVFEFLALRQRYAEE